MNEHQYLHNGTYHSDTSAEYMTALGIDKETQEGIINQKTFEAEQLQIQRLKSRKEAYESESDPLFLEALRKSAAGDEEGAEVARTLGLMAIERIKTRFPLE